MTGRFEGLHAVITGGARGIGAAITAQLKSEGAITRTADILDGSCDLTKPEEIETYFANLTSIDVLVCVAGELVPGTIESTTVETFHRAQALNLESVWLSVKAALPLLRKSESPSVVTIASYQAVRPNPGTFPYAVAKGGLISLTRSLAVDLAPQIRVNGILPGQIESVRTDAYFNSFRDPVQARQRTLESFPLRRLGKPEDIAKAVAFLASADAGWITGTILTVDGGRDAAGLDLSSLREPPSGH